MSSHSEVITKIRDGFQPEKHGLPADFHLTQLTKMKGCGCKVPRDDLLELLKDLKNKRVDHGDAFEVGIGLDSCVIPLRHAGLSLVQTTDFFYPLIDDPYLMGRVTCANVLSDLYAMGVADCDNMLMLLGVSTDLQPQHRDTIVGQFLRGFEDAAGLAETKVRGGQTVRCPWLLLGGVATSVCSNKELLRIDGAQPGDVLVLTKPLGGQLAVNSHEWLYTNPQKIKDLNLNEDKIRRAYRQVCEQMCRLNRSAARLLHKHNAHASTDVTGFGILGHADNLAKAQKANVQFKIERMPVIEYMDEISRAMPGGNGFRLFTGTAAETSGGLLLALKPEDAGNFCKAIEELDGLPAWIIGTVIEGEKGAVISEECEILPVPSTL